mmetsp:Transcript_104512/g.305107  ORF Transcript_104512/g.305107 Transcript_104512/m.305107 type:complete len:216 (-) Transcript_104512:1021-1668(-)
MCLNATMTALSLTVPNWHKRGHCCQVQARRDEAMRLAAALPLQRVVLIRLPLHHLSDETIQTDVPRQMCKAKGLEQDCQRLEAKMLLRIGSLVLSVEDPSGDVATMVLFLASESVDSLLETPHPAAPVSGLRLVFSARVFGISPDSQLQRQRPPELWRIVELLQQLGDHAVRQILVLTGATRTGLLLVPRMLQGLHGLVCLQEVATFNWIWIAHR